MTCKKDMPRDTTKLKEIAEKVSDLCPVCKGETGRKCKICDGTGKTKARHQ